MIIPRRPAYMWLFFWTGMMIAHGAFADTGHRQECHRNAKQQLVCRTCWITEGGMVRCTQPRIVR